MERKLRLRELYIKDGKVSTGSDDDDDDNDNVSSRKVLGSLHGYPIHSTCLG